MKKTKIIALLLTLVMAMGLIAACGSDDDASGPAGPAGPSVSQTPAPANPGQPTMPAQPDPGARIADHIELVKDNAAISVVNPHAPGASGGMVWFVYTMIYDRLIYRFEGGTEIRPLLATSFETDDYQTFYFNLREDVYFHNGEHFNADTVVWNLNYAWSNPGAEANNVWNRVVEVEAVGPYRVKMVTRVVDVDFYLEIGLPSGGMLSPQAMTSNPETGAWIGTGPWTITNFATGNFVELARNEDYWDRDNIPPTKTLALRYIPEPAARLISLQNNECQWSFGINSEDVVFFMDDPDYDVFRVPNNMIQAVWFNMNHPITGDLNFRLAVAHALDFAEIALFAADIWADPVTGGSIWGRFTAYRNNDIPNRPRDLDLARQYLADSAYNGEEIVIWTAILTMIRAAEVVQQQLEQIGLRTVIHQTDMAGMNTSATYENNQIEMAVYLSALRGSAGSVRDFFYPGAFRNGTSYHNERVAEIIDLSQTEGDPARRQALLYEMQDIMYEELPMVPIFWRVHGFVGSSRLGGFYLTAESTHNFRNVYLLLDD